MSKTRTIVDLSSMAKELEQTKATKKLSDLIGRAAAHNSVRSDLEQVLKTITLLRSRYLAVPEGAEPEEDMLINRGLFTDAVMRYVRATKTSSEYRKAVQVTPAYSAAQLEEHEYVCSLRDDAIGHYGPGGGELPHESSTLYAEFLGAGRLAIGWRGHAANYRARATDALIQLCPLAITYLSAKTEEATGRVADELSVISSQGLIPPHFTARHMRELPDQPSANISFTADTTKGTDGSKRYRG